MNSTIEICECFGWNQMPKMIGKKFLFDIKLRDEGGGMKKIEEASLQNPETKTSVMNQ
jgi:hypothetical protein